MINLRKGTTGFILYGLTLHNAAKFHVKLTSSPPEGALPGVCDTEPYGKGYIVWGITLLTPSKWFNSAGYQLTPSWARNSDGVDPGTTDIAYCGVIACSTISTGDDQIAIKGGHWVENLTIAAEAVARVRAESAATGNVTTNNPISGSTARSERRTIIRTSQ